MTAQFLRMLAVALLAVLVQAGALAGVLMARLPAWWSLLLLPALLAAWFAARLGRRLWRRLRGRRVATRRQVPPDAALAQAWERALRRGGAAHDGAALPWFLLLGATGAGKTTALRQARIPSPVASIHDASGDGAGFGWWYLNRLVILDCGDCLPERDAGAQVAARWDYHLRMLHKLRRREGLDGVVIALSARELLQGDPQSLAEQARSLRARLEELVTLLRQRFPVYVLLTHCDVLYGLDAWARALPEHQLEQALGYLAGLEPAGPQDDFVDRAFDAVGERLNRLRWQLLARQREPGPGLLVFPLELQALREPLQAFADNALAPHPYLEPLLLRGLFFSSGKQEPALASRVLGAGAAPGPLPGLGQRGLFLREVFARVLPAERGLGRPSAAQLRRRRRTRRLLLGLGLAAALAAGAALSASFAGNLRALRQLRAAALPPELPSWPPAQRAARLLERERAIRRFEAAGHAALARATLVASGWQAMLAAQKREFLLACRGLPRAFPMLEAAPAPPTGAAALYLLRRLAVLRARSEGGTLAQLEGLPPPRWPRGDGSLLDDTLWQLELAQLAWAPAHHAEQALRSVRTRLDQLGLRDPLLPWLRQTPALDGVPALHLEHLLAPGEQAAEPGALSLPAEYTATGFAHMREVMASWRRLSARPLEVDTAWRAFVTDWRARQLLELRRTLESLLSSPPSWRSRASWRAALGLLAGADNPDWAINRRLLHQVPEPSELAPADAARPAPRWLAALRELESWRVQATAPAPGDMLESLRTLAKHSLRAAPGAATALRENLRAVSDMREYLQDLARLSAQLELGDAQATAVAADYQSYGADPKTSASLAREAQQALQRLSHLLDQAVGAADAPREHPAAAAAGSQPGAGDSAGPGQAGATYPAHALLAAPWRGLMRYADAAAACGLQHRWQAEVLWPLQTAATREDALRQVFGAQGTLWAFVNGPAAPFLQRDDRSFRPARTAGLGVAFTPGFLDLLNRAARQRAAQDLRQQDAQLEAARRQAQQRRIQAEVRQLQSQVEQARQQEQAALSETATVSITALPTDVEPPDAPGAYRTLLRMHCAAGDFESNNLNLPVQGSVTWSARDCAGLRLSVFLGGLVLRRDYPGALGFADFLAAFGSGTRAFTPEDFPAQSAALRAQGVRRIVLHDRIDGAASVLRAADALRAARRRAEQLEQALQALRERQQQELRAAEAAASAPGAAASAPGGAGTGLRAALPARIAECPDEPRPPPSPT